MTFSRRVFMGQVAAASVATRLDGLSLGASPSPRIAVIGASAFGGWTALHLRRRGADVVLVDAWGAGNARASSGGETRVIRALYGPDRVYSEMVKRAYELWEELDASTPERLYVDTGVLWLVTGDDAYVRASLPILHDLGFPVDRLTADDAKQRYPQIDFTGVRSIYVERRAGALFASRACGVVRDAFEKAGGTYRIASAEPGPIVNGTMSALRCSDGTRIEADAFVFACGPWLGRLFPDVVADTIRPTRQEVYYFGTPAGSQRYLSAHLPIWLEFGERIVYGFPDVDGRGFKVADDTRGETFDPTGGDRTPSPEGIARARTFLAARFPELAKAPLVKAEVCQYENSPDGNLILDRHPYANNVWLAGGGSGHGFKLSPVVGELIADAVLLAKQLPKNFALARLRDAKKPATQFERKE
jgi:monomeric sarcosine oxidase